MPTIRKPIFVVPASLGTITTGNERTSNPAVNLGRPKAISLTWKTNGTLNTWVRGDFGQTTLVNFAAIIAANAQAGTLYRLRLGQSQAEVDGAALYDSGWQKVAPFLPADNDRPTLDLDFVNQVYELDAPGATELSHSHLEMASTMAVRWWRLDISGHVGDFEAATLVLGEAITPSRYYNFDFERGVEDMGDLNISRWGVFDETPGTVMRTLSFTMGWQTEEEFQASFAPMAQRLGKRGIVYVCFNPDANSERQFNTYLGVFRKAPFARGIRKARRVQQEFDILSMI